MTFNSEDEIGELNKDMGICGFAASIYMACKIDPRLRPKRSQGNLLRRLLAEIVHFLQELEKTDKNLLREIETFTRSFDPSFDIKNYKIRCNNAMDEDEIDKIRKYDIGMPPKAVASYLKHAWNINAEVKEIHGWWQNHGNGIIGLCAPGKVKTGPYKNLLHWVYRHNSTLYSYGRTYKNLKEFNKEEKIQYKVGWKVSKK